MSPDLLAAYENADYTVLVEPELVLKIGEKSPRLDALMARAGAETAAYITAANPGGNQRPAAENRTANSVLGDLIAASGYPHFPGEGRDPDSHWAAEESFLVLGIYRDNAKLLGRLFGQNAVVFVEIGKAPELVVLTPQ